MRLASRATVRNVDAPILARVTTHITDSAQRADEVFLSTNECPPDDPRGYAAWLLPNRREPIRAELPTVWNFPQMSYLTDGDVVGIATDGWVRALYRRHSRHNAILMTERCNSYCLMCSQPPKPANDAHRIQEHLRLIELIDPETAELGITGGEPTLFKDDFILLLRLAKERLSRTALHVLTNGRMFFYRRFAEQVASIGHPDVMFGIPLYSDVDSEHDYIVQAKGAFEETMLGLHHLARYDVPVEIRVVLHRQTTPRLVQLAEFIARNLPFAAHVALMGLEMFGLVHQNLEQLWIDPFDYSDALGRTVDLLMAAGLPVSIYNHQLCTLPRSLWPLARKSISDWKNVYLDECKACLVRQECGGFFHSAVKRHSAHVAAIRATS